MFRAPIPLAVLTLCVLASACGPAARDEAAVGIARFLDAARAGDRIGFEARIDRPALREDLRGQLVAVARANGVDVDGGPSDAALDRMIAPEAFRLILAPNGRALTNAPSPRAIAADLKIIDGGKVCIRDPQAETECLLTFARGPDKDAWRLVAMRATDRALHLSAGGE